MIEYIKNDLNIHRKIITVAERNVRLTEKEFVDIIFILYNIE